MYMDLAILATMLAPTDAALGKAVVSNESVPANIREGLNVESGLNDGICVPILFVFLALAAGTNAEENTGMLALKLVAEEIGIGLVVGLGLKSDAKLFLGWFGPRGLASIVFAIIVLDAKLPGGDTLAVVVACTIILSILAHGLTAIPFATAFGKRASRES